jgi:uncharacterized membrane protein
MKETLDAFAFWLRSTPISEAIRVTPWLWPVCEILHFSGLSLLLGVAGFFDLRLLGFLRRVPISAAWTLMPWAKTGFAVAAITGVIFFVGAPDQYVNNAAFWAKVAFLVIANLNAMYFEVAYRKQVERHELDANPPGRFKAVAAVSIASWFLVIYWGRMLPFIGNAF